MAMNNFRISGQGVFFFAEQGTPCCFSIYDRAGRHGLYVEIGQKGVLVNKLPENEPLIDKESGGLCGAPSYWFSIDYQNQQIYAGMGEARLENCIYRYTMGAAAKAFLESLSVIHAHGVKPLRLLKDPLVAAIPMVVKDMDSLTMDDIAGGAFLPKANLSAISKTMYECIAGRQFLLDDADFPEFSEAIEHSIRTPGLWCYEKLKEKASEFGKPNPLETYLRITLGRNNGESPGVPYVMEIWPVGHYSPVHSHAGAEAVIRVLHGTINVSLFPYLGAEVAPFTAVNFKAGDITWISPELNQIHQLRNLDTSSTACITIQCYMYDVKNKEHYDFFDYLDEVGSLKQYDPDSDMDFVAFKKLMKEEWAAKRLLMRPRKLCSRW